MARPGSYTRAHQMFADQFDASAQEDFVYRKSRKGAPIRVSARERDAFVEGFAKNWRRAQWAFFCALFVMTVIMATVFEDPTSTQSETFMYVGMAVLIALFFIAWRWAWNAPARALAERQPEGPPLERKQARREALRRMPWGQFALSGLVAIIGAAWLSSKADLLSGWGRLWLVCGALYLAMLAVRIVQKWQAETDRD